MAKSIYVRGLWNVICDVCGRQFKSNELIQRWDGLMVCRGDWEPRQPQDFVRGVADIQSPPWSRPEASDTFIGVCTPAGSTAIIDYAVVDCVRPDYVSTLFLASDYPIACIPITISVDTTQYGTETWWACGQASVSANFTLNGTLGVY